MNIALLNLKKTMRFMMSRGPRYATFLITNRCNRNCIYCVVPKHQNSELSTSALITCVDRVTDWGVRLISFCGGEPTLRKDLPEIIKHASGKAATNLTSNGDAFIGTEGKNYLNSLISAGLSSITLSLHDINDLEQHLHTLRFAKQQGVIPILATVATRTSINYLPEVMKAANKHGIMFRYALCQTVAGSFSPADVALRPTAEQISTFTDIVWKQKRQTQLVLNTYDYLRTASLYPNYWHCDNHKDHWIVMNSDGNLMVCSEWPTSISVTSILSLNDPRWTEARTSIRMTCPGCTHHCYVEAEETKGFALLREGINHAIALLRVRNGHH